MATYDEISNWVKERYGYTIKTCWIADVKEQCGLPVREAWNRRGKKRENPCPKDKIRATKAALKHFGMI